MKPVTKENLLEAIQKVEDQNRLIKRAYIGSGGCRCVIGHLMDDYEIEYIVNTNLQNRTVDALSLDLTTRELITLSDLQVLNDHSQSVEEFMQKAKSYVERHYELTESA